MANVGDIAKAGLEASQELVEQNEIEMAQLVLQATILTVLSHIAHKLDKGGSKVDNTGLPVV